MNASFMEVSKENRTEENLASQPSKSLHNLRSTELGSTDDNQESGKCHHFSIRGYVSEVRKTNREICWPFHIIDKQYKLEEHANLLPPLVVTEFRWWGCKSCLHKGHPGEDLIQNGAVMNSHNLEDKSLKTDGAPIHRNPVVESHAHASSLLSNFGVASGGAILGESSAEADSFINVNDSCFQPLGCFTDKESVIAGSTGIHKHEVHFVPSEGNQNISSETPENGDMYCKSHRKEEADATEIRKAAVFFETHKTGCDRSDGDTANTAVGAASISQKVLHSEKTAPQGENAHSVISTEPKETKLRCHVSETELDTRILASITNSSYVFRSRDDQGPGKRDMIETKEVLHRVNSSVKRTNKCDIKGLEGNNHRESNCGRGLLASEDYSQDCPLESDILNVNFHRRKPRKVRTLNDIIKSEVLGLSRLVHLPYRDAIIQSRDDNNIDRGASNDEKSAADCNLNVVSKEREMKLFISKKRMELSDGEDEGPSLMHWLRRVPKKVKPQKYDEGDKPVDNVIISSQSVADGSSGKCIHSRTVTCGSKGDKNGDTVEGKMLVNITHVDAPHPRGKLQDFMINTNQAVVEGGTAKQINVGKTVAKLSINNHTLYPGWEHHGGPCKDGIMNKNHNTMYVVEYGACSPINGQKDPFGTSEHENLNISKGSQQIPRKRSVRGKDGVAEHTADATPVTYEAVAVDGTEMREKQAATPIREKQAAMPIRGKQVSITIRDKQASTQEKRADPPNIEKQAVVDGIPIEILELLQSNYHKNLQLNYGHSAARVAESSETNENVTNGSFGKLFSVIESNSNAVPSSQSKNKSGMYSKPGNTGNGASAIGKLTGNSNQELRAHTSPCSRKRTRQIKEKEGKGPTTFRVRSDAHLSLALPMNGAQTPRTEPIGGYCPQNHSWNRVLLQNVESCYNALAISTQHPCRCFPHGAVQSNNSHKIQPGIYNSSLLPQTTPLERNPRKVTQDKVGLKLVDSTFGHLPRIKQKNDVKNKRTHSAGNAYLESGQECRSKVMKPLNLYTNDTIPAMHLLQLMDPAVGSASPLSPPVNNDQAQFLGKFKHGENNYQREFVGVDTGMRIKEAFNRLGISEHQVYSQTSSSNLHSPVPRYGTLESFSRRRISSGSNSFKTPYEFKGIHSSEVASSLKAGRKEKRKSCHLAIQPRLTDQRTLSSRFQSILSSGNYPWFSESRENEIQVECRNKDEVEFPVRTRRTELCVVNRNPADFSMLDEDNAYMIRYEHLKPRNVPPRQNKQIVIHQETPRKQRIMKLTSSKGNVRH